MEPLRVFVSSTWIDLLAEREAIEQAARRLESIRFVGMEYFGARTATTRQASLEEVDRSHVYLGVVGHRWGSGITEAEYRRAIARGLPCLIYHKATPPTHDPQPPQDAERLAAWLRELRDTHTVVPFATPPELATRVVADLHNLIFDRLGLQGARHLHGDYDGRIQRFLTEYLGTPDAPVPFGGRDAELAQLDRWLADPRGAPYAVVAGPAGRGKSALLVHWARRLTRHADLSLVYFPISIRFRTNLASVAFTSIAARLSTVYGEPLLAGPDTPTEVWREMTAAYLRRPAPDGRRVLVILDGADETADWELGPDLLPAVPSERVRVVVSARYLAGDVDARGWIARLGWNGPRIARPFDLPPLSARGLVDVLRKSSVPLEVLSQRADVVAELFRLTEGDPLLVNLYVSDLWARGEEVARLRPEDLGGLEPGLEGYFRRWWDDQRTLWGDESPFKAPAVEAVFNALACALGPLRTAELLELLPASGSLTVWALDDVMRSLNRFVVGDGDAQGYALSHPRLGDYFYDRLARAGQQREQDLRFVNWGRAWLTGVAAGIRAATTVPTYLLYFMRPHFDRAACPADDYLGMASNAWVQAWERIDKGSHDGFLGDLRRVCEIAARENDGAGVRHETMRYLAVEVRGALCMSSIASQAADMSAALLRALFECGVWTSEQAIAYATRIPDQEDRFHSILGLVAVTTDADRPLAVAAGLGELRVLLASDEGIAIVRRVLRNAATASDLHAGPAMAGRFLEAASRIARHGVTADQREIVRAAVNAAAAACTAHPEQQATVRAAAASSSTDPAAVSEIALLRAAVARHSRSSAAERLSLLRRATADTTGPDADRWRAASLAAATQVLGSAIVAGHDIGPDGISLLCRAWRALPHAHADASRAATVPFLSPRQLNLVTEAVRRLPPPERLDELRAILRDVSPASQGAVAAAMHVDELLAQIDSVNWRHDLAWAAAASEADVRTWFQAHAARLEPDEGVALCVAVVCRRAEAALCSFVAERALSIIADDSDTELAQRGIVALLDLLEPEGSGDSFEEWRRAATATRIGPSAWDIRRMLAAAKMNRSSLWTAAQRLRSRLAPASAGNGTLRWVQRLEIAAGLAAQDLTAEPAAPGTTPVDAPERLAQTILAATTPPSLITSLRTLAAGIEGIDPSIARDAVPYILAAEDRWGEDDSPYLRVPSSELVEALMLLPSPKLWPLHADTAAALPQIARVLWARNDVEESIRKQWLDSTPMPDVSREAIFSAALRAPLTDVHIPVQIARLARPSDDLVTRTLAAVRRATEVSSSARADCLVALLPAVRELTLVRWLEAASTLDRDDLRRVIRGLITFGPDASAHFGPVLDAVARLESAQQRERWLIELAVEYRTWRVDDAIALAAKLPDPRARLRTWCALIGRLPPERRPDLLGRALRLSTDVQTAPEISRTLVQMAVDLMPASQAVLGDATAAAVAITDRDLRSDALAALARVLPADQTATAVAAARRIGDVAPQARAMRVLARSCSTASAEAVERMLAAVRSFRGESVQAAASIYVSPVVEPTQRWPMLASALASPVDGRTGFEWPELFDAIAEALVDAPARLMSSALSWAGARPPSPARTRMLVRMFPSLPRHLRLPASVLMAAAADRPAVATLSILWAHEALDAARQVGRIPADTRRWLDSIASRQQDERAAFLDAGALDATMAAHAEQMLQAADSDVARHAAVCRVAVERHLPPAAVRLLAETAAGIGDGALRRDAIRSLAAWAPARSLAPAADAVAAIAEPSRRGTLQVRLAQRQAGRARDKTFESALASIAAEPDPRYRLAAAVTCAVAAPSHLVDVLDIVGATEDMDVRVHALRELIARLPDSGAAAIVPRVPGMLSEECAERVLCDVAGAGRAALAAPVLSVAGGFRRTVARARLLAAWAPFLEDDLQDQATRLLEGITTDFAWLDALAALAARWPVLMTDARATRAAAMLIDIADDEVTFGLLRSAAPAWPPSALRSYAAAARTLRDDSWRCAALGWAASLDSRRPSPDMVEVAREIRDPRFRAMALGRAAVASEPADELLLQEALRHSRRTGHHALRIGVLVSIVEHARAVPGAIVDELVEEIPQHPSHAMQAFRALAPRLDAEQSLAVLRALPQDEHQAESAERVLLLQDLAPRLAPRHLAALLSGLTRWVRPRHVSRLIASLAPLLDDEEARSAALATALGLGRGTWGAHAQIALVDRLDPPRQRQVLAALTETPIETERLRRLTLVRPKLDAAVLADWQQAASSVRPDIRSLWSDTTDEGPVDTAAGPDVHGDGAATERLIEALLGEVTPGVGAARGSPRPAARPATRQASTCAALLQRLDVLESEHDRFDEIRRAAGALTSGDRAALLERLGDYLKPQRHDLMVPTLVSGLRDEDQQAFARLLDRIGTTARVGSLLRACAPHLGTAIRPHLLAPFRAALHAHAGSHRSDALAMVEAWAPAVALLGGPDAAVDVIGAIKDVAEQWP